MNSLAANAGNSGAEEKFIQLFCDVFGPEKGQYVYLQFPFCDIYGKNRSIDFAIKSNLGKIAFEVDGRTWHDPSKVSSDKYIDDLLKQNSMIYDGWKVYRWTDDQIEKTPERVKSELITFLGTTPILFLFDENMPSQTGKVIKLRRHQEDALANLNQMRIDGESIALVQGATGSGKSAIGVLDAKSVGKRTLFLAHTKELVEQGYDNFSKLWPEASCGKYVDDKRDKDTKDECERCVTDALSVGYRLIDTAQSYFNEEEVYAQGAYDFLHGASRAISDYTPSVDSMRLENMVNNHDQKGDPDKAGKLIVELISSGNLPKRLPLGSDAVRIIRDELKSRLAEVEKTESYSITTDY